MKHYEVIVIGTGVAGISQIKRLADLGIEATVLEAGSDIGGTLYLEGALLRPARESALPQPPRRQVRPAQVHAVHLPGRGGAPLST